VILQGKFCLDSYVVHKLALSVPTYKFNVGSFKRVGTRCSHACTRTQTQDESGIERERERERERGRQVHVSIDADAQTFIKVRRKA
jgi:hypothetical protein